MTVSGSSPYEAMASIEERLAVAEDTLRALRAGEADAFVMVAERGEQRVYPLESEDRPYRRLVERMSEGAALVDPDGLIVNRRRSDRVRPARIRRHPATRRTLRPSRRLRRSVRGRLTRLGHGAGRHPTRPLHIAGAMLCLVGVAVIMYAPRTN